MTLFIKREMIEQLVELADRYRGQAGRCADAGAYEAALVMMASAIETMLFSTITMSQHVLEDADNWPGGDPYEWTLGRLIGIATRAGWFEDRSIPGDDLAGAVDAINSLRVSAVHPAAYIRDGGTPLSQREFAAAFGVLLAVDYRLTRVLDELPPPPRDRL